MASQAKVIIKGQNNIGSAVKSAASDLNSMKAAADNPGAALKSAFTFTAILASVKKLGDGLVRANRKGKIRVSRKGTMNSQEKRDIKPY